MTVADLISHISAFACILIVVDTEIVYDGLCGDLRAKEENESIVNTYLPYKVDKIYTAYDKIFIETL